MLTIGGPSRNSVPPWASHVRRATAMWRWHVVLFPRANGRRGSVGYGPAEGTAGSCLNRQNFANTIGKPLWRKAFHVGEGGLRTRGRYFSTVDLATVMPSLRSSPTMRGDPHRGLERHISWMRSQTSWEKQTLFCHRHRADSG